MRLLIVDHDVNAASALAELLRACGHDVVTIADGLRAVAVVRAFRPAVVFLDLGLPVLDGYDVAAQIRSHESGSELAIVALTGYALPSFVARAAAYGFDAHLVTPVSLDDIKQVLARVTSST